MRAWMRPAGSDGFDKLYPQDLPDPTPGPGEVLIAPHAWSINYRDFAVAAGKYFGGALTKPAIPLSDGAGEVLAVGDGVTGFAPGDKVQGSFFHDCFLINFGALNHRLFNFGYIFYNFNYFWCRWRGRRC